MSRVLKTVGRLCGCCLLALPLAVLASGDKLQTATDLRAEAERASRFGGPLILLFSRQDCPYCQTIKRDHLRPLASNLRYRDKVVVRQIDQDSDAAITDFGGERSTHSRFAVPRKSSWCPSSPSTARMANDWPIRSSAHACRISTRAISNRRSRNPCWPSSAAEVMRTGDPAAGTRR